jgi:uncharacterized membrane protein
MPADQQARAATAPPMWLRRSALTICLLGVAASAYLTFEHFTSSATLACPETGVVNCAKVTTSSYSNALGIPVALLGLAYFLGLTGLCTPPAWCSPNRMMSRARLAAVCVGALFVIYLLWAELFRINAICLWCTAVHVLALALFALVLLSPAVAGPEDRTTS